MNNKKLNCHPERVEGSQLLHISPRDVAENVKLNHEIAEEVGNFKNHISLSCQCPTLASRSNKDSLTTWILRSSRSMTRMYVLLSIITLIPTFAQAEQCTPTPDCKSLGYTETSCPDGGGVKCPWNTSLMYCCKKCEEQPPCMSCFIGWILNSDMTCTAEKISGKTPIGVVTSQTITIDDTLIKCTGVAVALNDIGNMNWSNANSQCSSYSASGVTGWHLPTKDELLFTYSNRTRILVGLKNARGTDFVSNYYWSSSYANSSGGFSGYWYVDPVNGGTSYHTTSNSRYVRPVLAF